MNVKVKLGKYRNGGTSYLYNSRSFGMKLSAQANPIGGQLFYEQTPRSLITEKSVNAW